MNAFVRCYGDTIVNSYREADHQLDKMIDALEQFVKEPEFHQEYKEMVELNIVRAKQSAFALHGLEQFIIEMEGSGYGD